MGLLVGDSSVLNAASIGDECRLLLDASLPGIEGGGSQIDSRVEMSQVTIESYEIFTIYLLRLFI